MEEKKKTMNDSIHTGTKSINDEELVENGSESTTLQVQGVSKVYESPAGTTEVLKDINFSIGRGEFVSIVGPSGSG
ncbi:MAG TPA: hypothetical protein VER14_10090, partial [Phototrophicaceae bacterium]|nr:hypothetical protein [Phototrophicaceae bacterium]